MFQEEEEELKSVVYDRRPFILRPERNGFENWLDVLTDLGKRRGNPDWVNSFVPSMKAKGKMLGIDLDFGGKVGNSLDSLRILKFVAKTRGSEYSERLADLLAKMHFEQRRCVCDHKNLLEAAVEIGCSSEKVKSVLRVETIYRNEGLSDINLLHRSGIHSIPFFQLVMSNSDDDGNSDVTRHHHGASSVNDFFKSLRDMRSELRRSSS